MTPENVTPTDTPAGMRPKMRYLLIGSLALNLVVLGVVAGSIASHKRGDFGPPSGTDFRAPHVQALSHADKRKIGRDIRKSHKSSSQTRKQQAALYKQMAVLIGTVPFDKPAVLDLRQKLDTVSHSQRAVAFDAWLDRVAGMDNEERAQYAARMLEILAEDRHQKRRK